MSTNTPLIAEIALAVAQATLTESDHPCNEYFDPDRMDDFASAIVSIMTEDGSSYEEAKAVAFDETSVPAAGSPCDKMIRRNVDILLAHEES